MPYAIIRTGGHQEKVMPGEQIAVDRLKQEVGQQVTFTPLAVSKGEAEGEFVSDKGSLEGAAVIGTIVQHIKADKVESFQYRHKTGYRRHTGHRQPMTLVEILEIQVAGQTFKAPEKPAEPEPAAVEGSEGGEAPAKKPAAKKSTAKKSTAKKSTAKKAATKK